MELDDRIDWIRSQYDSLRYWVYLMSAGTGPAGNYWLKAIADYQEFLRLNYTEPLLRVHAEREQFCKQGIARLIKADEIEVTNSYRVMAAANMVINNLTHWEKGDKVVFSD